MRNLLCSLACLLGLTLSAQVNQVYPGMKVWAGMQFSTNAASANSLAWLGELGKNTSVSGDATTTLAVTNGAAQNSTVSVIVTWQGAAQGVTSVGDASGNSYTLNWQTSDGAIFLQGWSCKLGSALSPGGNISVTWSNASYSSRAVWAGNLSGSTGVDVSPTKSEYSATIACSGTVTNAPVIAVGAVGVTGGGGYSVGNFTLVSSQVMSGSTIYYLQAALPTSGSKDMGGTLSPANTYESGWSAFK